MFSKNLAFFLERTNDPKQNHSLSICCQRGKDENSTDRRTFLTPLPFFRSKVKRGIKQNKATKKMDSKRDSEDENLTRPKMASEFRVKDVMLFKNVHPCKITKMSSCKTGKHGASKTTFHGSDIFTGKQYKDMSPSTHMLKEVVIQKFKYQILAFNGDSLSLISDEDKMGPEIPLSDIDPKTLVLIQQHFESLEETEEEQAVSITLMKAMGRCTIEDPRLVPLKLK